MTPSVDKHNLGATAGNRMHWFWRAILAAIGGWFFGQGVYSFVWDIVYWVRGTTQIADDDPLVDLVWNFQLVVVAIIAVAIYAVLSRLRENQQLRETRCRRCGYILRGITEPRCSECGERI